MKKKIVILGSTGSIGKTTIEIIKKDKNNFDIILLSANNNFKEINKQIKYLKPKNLVINNKKIYLKLKKKYKKINIFNNFDLFFKKFNKKVDYTIAAISGLSGLQPTLDIIKHTKNVAIANKESIICAWNLIEKELKKNNTKFIPVDSEHFSIWSLLQSENKNNVKKIYLTASGGPFLNKNLNAIKNISPKEALKHPNWKMGKKISIDSATMMNKIFEVIEAIKIFNLDSKKVDILIHPKSYVHAIVNFNNGLTKLLAHPTTMEVPIANAIYNKHKIYKFKNSNFKYDLLNGLNFIKPDIKKFPLLSILNFDFKNTYLEIILVSLNDALVKKYLNYKISYFSIHSIMIKLLKKPYFTKFYSTKPNNINDIKIMVQRVNQYVDQYVIK